MDTIAINLGNQLAREKTVIELTVRVSDGSFDAQLSFPVTATREEINRVVEGWMKMMREAVYMFKPEIRPLAGSAPANITKK